MENKEVKIKVIGIGGAGNNAINLMLEQDLDNVELYVANTDFQDLETSPCQNKIFLGNNPKGCGAGGNPELAKQFALESEQEISNILQNTDLLIISAGLGGGTGTGAAPIIAQKAREANILTLAIVNTPFELEGTYRNVVAQQGLENLKQYVDSYIVISNQKLLENYPDLPINDSFKVANMTLVNTVKIVHDLIFLNGKINLDFNDLSKILKNGQNSIVGVGQGFGKNKINLAVNEALNSNLFLNDIRDCKKMILLFDIDQKVTLNEISKAKDLINQSFDHSNDMEIILGINQFNLDNRKELFKLNIIASNATNNSTTYQKVNYKKATQQSIYRSENKFVKKLDNDNNDFSNTEINNNSDKDNMPEFFN